MKDVRPFKLFLSFRDSLLGVVLICSASMAVADERDQTLAWTNGLLFGAQSGGLIGDRFGCGLAKNKSYVAERLFVSPDIKNLSDGYLEYLNDYSRLLQRAATANGFVASPVSAQSSAGDRWYVEVKYRNATLVFGDTDRLVLARLSDADYCVYSVSSRVLDENVEAGRKARERSAASERVWK